MSSWPGTTGKLALPHSLLTVCRSEWQMPANLMSIDTSLAPTSRRSMVVLVSGASAPQAAVEFEPRYEPELVAALPAMVDLLSPASRVVLRMHYLEGLTYVEIAEALEISVGTVKSRLAYGLTTLRTRLPERHGVA